MTRCTHQALDLGHSPYLPTPLKVLAPGQKEPIAPTGTINNPFRTAKLVTYGNHRLMSKIETTSKVSLKSPTRINLGSRAVRCTLIIWLFPRTRPPPPPTNNTNNTQTAKAQHQNATHPTPKKSQPQAKKNPLTTSPGPQAPIPTQPASPPQQPRMAKATPTIEPGLTRAPAPPKPRKPLQNPECLAHHEAET